VPVAYSAPPTVQQEPTPAAPETKPDGLGGIEVSGSVKIWGGKILYRAEFGGGIAIDPACCCGGGCECISECPDGYGIRIIVPEEHEAFIVDEDGPRCSGGDFFHRIKVSSANIVYGIAASLRCEIVDDAAVWTLRNACTEDFILIDGTYYGFYEAINKQVFACDEDGVPQAQVVADWDTKWWGGPATGFPLDIEIFENPFP